MRKPLTFSCALLAAASALSQPAGDARQTTPISPGDLTLIASAMRAAPMRVAEAATIIVMEPGAPARTLRQGANGFTCMPDNPTTPGPDPMCMDRAGLDWVNAWMARRTPVAGSIGLVYMLQGGTDASNTDPYAQEPAAGNNWIETGPHLMIVGAPASFYAQYPRGAMPDPRAPYVMWPDTPYQHLMIPVI